MNKVIILVSFLLISFMVNSASMPVSSSGEYMMIPAKPLVEGGVSYNEFDLNKYSETKIKILNYPKLYGSDEAASSIVIKAPSSIVLKNDIEIVGEPASLVFVGGGVFNIGCTGCSFEGAERIIFSGGLEFSDANKSQVKKYYNAGTVTIDGLNAYKVPYIITIAKNTVLSGNIDLRNKASKDSSGNYHVGRDGIYYSGGSSFVLYNGNFELSGETFEPINMKEERGQFNLITSDTLELKASNIKIVNGGSEKLVLKGRYDTRSDVASVYTINGKLNAINEGVFVSLLAKGFSYMFASTPASDIIFYGSIITDGQLYVSTQGNAVVKRGYSLTSNDMEAYTKKTFYNDGAILSDHLDISSNIITNRNSIKSKFTKLTAKTLIENNHGGSILGTQVALSSEGFVLNGSRSEKVYCYYEDSFFGNAIAYSCPNRDDGIYVNENIRPLSLGVYEDVTFGSFYRTKMPYLSLLKKVETYSYSDSAGYIYADNLFIKSKYVENINPYNETSSAASGWVQGIPIDFNKARQVGIAADSKLEIVADEYFLNSSALVIYNNSEPSNALLIKSKSILNERYRMSALYKFEHEYSGGNQYNVIKPHYYNYSLPGQIRSVGNIALEASKNLVNSNSYIESYSKMMVKSPSFTSYGLNVSEDAIVNASSVFNKIKALEPECRSAYLSKFCVDSPDEVEVISVDAPFETDTLVYAGEGIKSNSNFVMDNWNLIDIFENKIAKYIYMNYIRSCYSNSILDFSTTCDKLNSWDFNASYSDLSINYTNKYRSCSDFWGATTCSDNSKVLTVSAAKIIKQKLDMDFWDFLNSFKEEIYKSGVDS